MSSEILYVNHSAILGGGEISLLNLLQGLVGKPYRVLVASPGGGRLPQELARLGVRHVNLPISIHSSPKKFAQGAWRVRQQTSQVRIVHGNSTRSLRVTVILGWLLRAKTIWHVRDLVDWERLPPLERWFARQVDVVIANSGAVAERLSSLPVEVVHNPVDVTRFEPAGSGERVRAELGIAPHEKLVGVVGRLTVWKGQQTFIEAFQRVKSRLPDAKALIVGEEYQRSSEADRHELERFRQRFEGKLEIPSQVHFRKADLERLVQELGLDEQVILTGFRTDMPAVMSALDLLVLPSWWEPFGRVLIEAMACGKPVVATKLGGPAEIVRHQESGLLVPPLDADAMAEAICEILTQPKLASKMGEQGRLDALERFSLSQYVQKIENIYQRYL